MENLNLLGRPDLKASMSKISLWKLVQYEKVIFLDADTFVLQSIDHLFDLDADFAAAPDIGWPDIFNSGVFLTKPNMGTCAALMRLATGGVSFDGGDQGLLNTYFSSFHRLSFTYNVTPSSGYQYQPAYKHFESQIKVGHFIGADKPWTRGQNAGMDGAYGQMLSRWWAVHDKHYRSTPQPYTPAVSDSATTFGSEPPLGQSWDGSKSAPPAKGRPQAAALSFAGFKNTWDEPRSSAFYSPSGSRTPKSVHFERSKGPVKNPVFPWEGKSSASRSFPEDFVAPIQEVRTIPRDDTSSPEGTGLGQPGNIQYSNAWDSHAEIKKFISDAGIATKNPREANSVWGSGTHTPREPEMPEGQSKLSSSAADIPGSKDGNKKDFLLSDPSGVPPAHEWNPSSAMDALASNAQTLAEKASERAKTTAQSVQEAVMPE